MRRQFPAVLFAIAAFALVGCGTAVGTAAGAGIGSIAGDTKTGALVGGGVGLMYDIFN